MASGPGRLPLRSIGPAHPGGVQQPAANLLWKLVVVAVLAACTTYTAPQYAAVPQNECTIETNYYGPNIGDTVSLVPGTAVATWFMTARSVSNGLPGMLSVKTTVTYHGRTGDRTYSFGVGKETLRYGSWVPDPENALTIYYESDTTLVSVNLLSLRLLRTPSDPRAVFTFHPESQTKACEG